MAGGFAMSRRVILWGLITTGLILGLVGCARNYVITHELDEVLVDKPTFYIGEFRDELPADYAADKKPTKEDIKKFKNALEAALYKKDFSGSVSTENQDGKQYEITGAILDYKKGSGFLRFLFGYWAGGAKVTTALELRNLQTKDIIFSGNFSGFVTDWMESGDQMYKNVSKDFVKALKKAIEKQKGGK